MSKRHISLSIVLLVSAGAANAYVLNGPKWGSQQVPYYINPVNGDMPEDAAIASIQAGAGAWATQSNANILPYYMGRTSGSTVSRNGKSELFFRNASDGTYYGYTYWWYDSSYHLIEADVVFYDATYVFYSGATGCSSGVYLEDATAHEFGHVLGLGHSSLSTASMYPTMSRCSTSVRTLDSDDLAGIEKLYPTAGSNTPPSITILNPASSSTFASNSSIYFSGSATDKEDGDLGSVVVWTSTQDGQIGTGASFTRVLSEGNHTITAKVTDTAGAVAEAQHTITVQAAGGFTLSGNAYKVKGLQKVDLTWSGTTAASIDVYRDGMIVNTTNNDGLYTDPVNRKGGGSYSYFVCGAGTSTCSNRVTIAF